MFGVSGQSIGGILRGTSHVAARSFSPRNEKFYPQLAVAGRVYSLGVFASHEEATAAYDAARVRARLGEPILLSAEEKPRNDDIRRWYQPPLQQLKFGDCEGELVVAVQADQEQSTFILHHALANLHPKVRKFIPVASETGDVSEAAQAAGLNENQVTMLLPRLKALLSPILH